MAMAVGPPLPMRSWSPPTTTAKKNNRPLPMTPWTPEKHQPRKRTLAGASRAVQASRAFRRNDREETYLPLPKFAELKHCYRARTGPEYRLHDPDEPIERVSTWVDPDLPQVREYDGSRLTSRYAVDYVGSVDYRLTDRNYWGPFLSDLHRTKATGRLKSWHRTKNQDTSRSLSGRKKTTFSDTVQVLPGHKKPQAVKSILKKPQTGAKQKGVTSGRSSAPANATEVTSLLDLESYVEAPMTQRSQGQRLNQTEVQSLVRSLGESQERSGAGSDAAVAIATTTPKRKPSRWYTRPKMDAYHYPMGPLPREEVGEEELSNFEDPPPEEIGVERPAKRVKAKAKKLPVSKVKAVAALSRLPPEVLATVSAYNVAHSM